ncbi:beta-hexosaminidase [Reticulomyxa filosa]|uniref:beta-N-acetylhexosaminidase n=1 Tax=Reticulomyxa filosa TaxID=46433 RepID=X6P8Y2_RETFI|nr:beta-hexosaminidase [Reticulomyxa filosa]|eukprot:ETO34651.1 beta-hexosaminidase [Reticulomyxa filosa]
MAANNFTTEQAYGYFVERAMDIAYYKYGLQVINWVEVFNNFNNTLNRNVTVIEVWKSKEFILMLAAAVEMGFRAILADDDLWYLDHLTVTWDEMYMNEPFADISNKTQQALVLGGEGCMWGETVDVSDIEQTVWPRASAIAERLWSPAYVNNTNKALPRIEYFRCLMNERGIAAAPVNNPIAREAPPGPGSCYDQRRR